MCGIIAVTGHPRPAEVLRRGLERLEYRGYDSSGVAVSGKGALWRARRSGRRSLAELGDALALAPDDALAGIGHTRWATHGAPIERNAHPHLDCTKQVALVHNGIVENWRELATELETRGHELESETDSELLAHLLEEELERLETAMLGEVDGTSGVHIAGPRPADPHAGDPHASEFMARSPGGSGIPRGAERNRPDPEDLPLVARALMVVLARVRGSFAVALLWAKDPDCIVGARRGSPLVVGVPDGSPARFIASDIPALLPFTRCVAPLGDDELVVLRPGSAVAIGIDGTPRPLERHEVAWDVTAAERGGHDDFMSKEIHEQPVAVADTLRGRMVEGREAASRRLRLEPLDEVRLADDELREVDKVFVVACGSSYHAGLAARYAIEHWARVPVEIDIASEFRYRDPVVDSRTLVVAVSQSGETLDTMEAARAAKLWGAKVLTVCNVVGSSLARQADAVVYTRAGPEVGVAATKTFLAQLVALDLVALWLAELRGTLFLAEARDVLESLAVLPEQVAAVLEREASVADAARRLLGARQFLFVGRHVGYPVALEGALKLKEISYLHAEGFPAGELKHGPIALVEEGTVVVAVASRTRLWEKLLANVAEVKSRGATVVGVVNDGDEESARAMDLPLFVPATHPMLSPVIDVVPLQLLAYHLARFAGRDVDRPRNLAKTVTVE